MKEVSREQLLKLEHKKFKWAPGYGSKRSFDFFSWRHLNIRFTMSGCSFSKAFLDQLPCSGCFQLNAWVGKIVFFIFLCVNFALIEYLGISLWLWEK
jgi:hypothetical protein